MKEIKVKDKDEKEKIKKEFLKTIKDLEKKDDVEKMIKNNRIHFKIENVDYKVRKPDYAEQLEIEKFRRKKYLEFIDDDSMMFRKQWIEKYKTKGIDIEKMDNDIIRLQNEIDASLLRLAKTENEKDVERIEDNIIKLKDEQASTNIERTDLLSYSIEDQLNLIVSSYYAFSVLEKKVGEEWVKVFNKYEDFVVCKDTTLMNKTFYYTQYLIYTLPL